MKKSYFDWADEYPNYVVLRKEGWLWRAKEECAFVLSNASNKYEIYERDNGIREAGCGQLDNMLNILAAMHINYVVIHFDEVIEESHFDDNQYQKYV